MFIILEIETKSLNINSLKPTIINSLHFGISNTIFVKNNYIPQNINRLTLLYILQISFMSGLIEDRWVLISAFTVNTLQLIV